MGISRRWLYKTTFLQQDKDLLLRDEILSILTLHPSYGHRRIALALDIGKKRTRRVMKKFKLKPYKRKARWRKRRDLRKKPAPFNNEIKHQCPLTPNYAWASDFTYLRFKGKFLYLATFLDLFTREIVGWQISKRHDKSLVIQAFLDAFKNKEFNKPKFVHSDQGSEYTSQDYVKLIESLGIQISMSTKSSPWENAYQESFYNNFKTDLGLEFDRFNDIGELLEAIHHTINYYNHHRIHTSLKMPPAEFAANFHSACTKRGA